MLKDREMFSDAISNAKKCEKLVLIHCIDDLMHQIYDLLAGLNFQTGNFNQSLSYNRRALAISSEAGDEKLILVDKIKLSTTFRELNMRDSSEYYTLKANDIAKVGNEVMKANALDNLSVYYLNRNRLDSAEYFIRRSLHISPSASSNIIYGDIKRRQGKLEEANGLWGKVSKEDALDLRIKALACMSDYKKEKGLYKDAVLLQDSMIALKNSLKAKQHSEENIQIQAGMDFEAYVDETGRDLYLLINAVVCAAAVIFAIMVGFFAKSRLAEKEVSNGREKMEKYKQDIRQSEQKNMEHVREKQKMQKRIDNLNDRHSYIIAHGKQLFEEIDNGGNTAEWNKTCFDDCVEYLIIEYPDRLKDIDIHYTGLTSQNIFFLFMKATGMKDRQLYSAS